MGYDSMNMRQWKKHILLPQYNLKWFLEKLENLFKMFFLVKQLLIIYNIIFRVIIILNLNN